MKISRESPFADARVVVLGDIILDLFINGMVRRISSEAPVPVTEEKERNYTLGGSANVAANLASLGAKPYLIGRVGHDGCGKRIKHMCKSIGVSDEYIITSLDIKSTCKTRIVANGQHVACLDSPKMRPLSDHEREQILCTLHQLKGKADVLIFTDNNRGLITQHLFDEVRNVWHGPLLVDANTSRAPFIDYTGCSIIKPNIQEIATLLNLPEEPQTNLAVEDCMRALALKYQTKSVLCTRSENGMSLLLGESVRHYAPAYIPERKDVSGGGDTAMATFAAGIANGMSAEHAAFFANVTSALSVSKKGTATTSWQEVYTYLHSLHTHSQRRTAS